MASRCSIDKKKRAMTGNKVSHSNRKTRRRFNLNMQNVTFFSEILNREVTLNLATNTIRTIEHNDGLDNFLLTTSSTKLTLEGRQLKKELHKAQETAAQ